MKIQILGRLALALFFGLAFGCSSSIKSVVDHSAFSQPYKRPLAVLFFEKDPVGLPRFSQTLGDDLLQYMAADGKKLTLLPVEHKADNLKLNESAEVNQKIAQTIQENENDLVIMFRPTHLDLNNGALSGIKYQITAIDVATKKEVWKSEFSGSNSFTGAGKLAHSISKDLYGRMVGDGIL